MRSKKFVMEVTKPTQAVYVRPGFFMARVVNPIAKAIGAPTLTVTGRKSGLPITIPLNLFHYGGGRYLIAGGGDTNWVRNLRAAGEGLIRIRGKQHRFRAVELLGEERDRVVIAFRDSMGPRARTFFRALPRPVDHPVFHVDTVSVPAPAEGKVT